MTLDEKLKALSDDLAENADVAHAARCELIALVQMLIDRRVLKGKEDEIVEEWNQRAADIRKEDIRDRAADYRARKLLEDADKLPKQ